MRNKTAFNRTLVLIAYMVLCGWVAFLGSTDAIQFLTIAGAPVLAYIGVKGKGK